MRKLLALSCIALLVTQTVLGRDQKHNPEQLKPDLLGTWDCVMAPAVPDSVRHIKHVTPTHYTWVTYDATNGRILATSGGTCSVKGDQYDEVCEFSSDTHRHLRAKTYGYKLKIKDDKWDLQGMPDSDIDVDEVWNRVKLAEGQKANTEQVGRALLGTWESVMPPEAPKAMRTVKHVTRTHWTWVAYDRDNKMVLSAAGGTWSLKGGKYVEACEFTTDNFPQARGKSFAYGFKIDDDQWTIIRGPEFENQVDETWKRVK